MRMNLCLDGHYLLYKNVYTLTKTKTLYGDLPQAMLNTYAKFANMCRIHNVFLVSDAKSSWRKAAYAAYKANRKKDDAIDFDFAFEVYADFKEHMKKQCHVLELDGAEGDDWINLIVRKSNSKGVGCIVVSADRDLNQLLRYGMDPLYLNMQVEDYATYERVFVPRGYELVLDKMAQEEEQHDLFSLPAVGGVEQMIANILQHWQVKEVDTTEHLFRKLVQGDKGDNVPSAYETLQKKKDGGTRPQGIGEATGLKMWHAYQAAGHTTVVTHKEDTPFYDAAVDALCEVKKITLDPYERDLMREKLGNNAMLMELNWRYVPKELLAGMVEMLQSTGL